MPPQELFNRPKFEQLAKAMETTSGGPPIESFPGGSPSLRKPTEMTQLHEEGIYPSRRSRSAAKANLACLALSDQESHAAEKAYSLKEAEHDFNAPPPNFPAVTYSPVTPTVTVPSALKGLTAVFGMGTGVTPPL
jgi:hypothetical protein